MAWYRTGTVAVTNGSKTVTGTSTAWVNNVQPGDAFIGPDGAYYEVDVVGGNTSLTLVENYAGATVASGGAYKIIPTQGRVRDLATQVLQLITDYSAVESAFTISGDGVGIGRTPATTALLDLQRDANAILRVRGGVGANQGAAFFGASGSDTTRFAFGQVSRIFGGTPGDDAAIYSLGDLSLAPGATIGMTLKASGNVGIGTASPSSRLHVASATNKWATFESTAVASSFMQFTQGGSASALGFMGGDGGGAVSGGSGTNLAIRAENSLLFSTGGNNERMRIDGSGNVGIGTASVPAGRRLVVAGGAMRLDNDAQLEFGGSTAGLYGNSTNNTLSMFTATTERVRVKATGSIRLLPLAADPAGPEAGELYFNSTTSKFRGHTGSGWVDLH